MDSGGTHHYLQMLRRPQEHSILLQRLRLGDSSRVIGDLTRTIGARSVASRVNESANANASVNAGPSERKSLMRTCIQDKTIECKRVVDGFLNAKVVRCWDRCEESAAVDMFTGIC